MSKLDRFKRQRARSNLYRIPLEGTHFRRQVDIGPYRVDFGLMRLKLLIEIDGLIHEEVVRKERDHLRSNWLENEGYRVIRFSNHIVTTDMNSVLSAIEVAIEDQKRLLGSGAVAHPTPPLSRRPSPSRGG